MLIEKPGGALPAVSGQVSGEKRSKTGSQMTIKRKIIKYLLEI